MFKSLSNGFSTLAENAKLALFYIAKIASLGKSTAFDDEVKKQKQQAEAEERAKQAFQAEQYAASWRKANSNDTLEQLRKELQANKDLAAASRARYLEMQKLGQLNTAEGKRVTQQAYEDALIVGQIVKMIDAKKDTSPYFQQKKNGDGGGSAAASLPGQVPFKYDVNRDFNDLNVVANRESGLDQGDTSKFGAAPNASGVTLSDTTQKKVDDYQKLQLENKKKIADAEIELAKKTEDSIAIIVKARYENELNAIQKNIDANNKAKEKETAAIQSSTLSQQEKAAAEINLNAQVEAKNEALRRKQRDIKVQEAKFDKDKAIFDIIANTASGVMKASPLIPLMALIAATGAVELAGVIAKPIPTYRKGGTQKEDSPMLVHPGEMIVDPGGRISMTPDAPETLTFGKRERESFQRMR